VNKMKTITISKNGALNLGNLSLAKQALREDEDNFRKLMHKLKFGKGLQNGEVAQLGIYSEKIERLVERSDSRIYVDKEIGERFQAGLNQLSRRVEYLVRLNSLETYRDCMKKSGIFPRDYEQMPESERGQEYPDSISQTAEAVA
jgi:hypothetical protein